MSTPDSRLDLAVARGIITDVQRAAILALGGEMLPPAGKGRWEGVTGVAIAYYAGAAAILFAFGWFLTDRWQVLGAAGVWTPALGSEPWFPGSQRDWESLRWISIELATALGARRSALGPEWEARLAAARPLTRELHGVNFAG